MPKTTQRHFCHVFCHVSSFLASKELTSWGGQLQLSEESVACRGSALEEGYLSMKRPLARFETWATGLQKLPFAGSFCDTTCNHAWVKPFASICSEKVGRLYHISRPVLLKCKGAVQQKPRYFPTPVLLKILKKRQQLAKRLGVGRCRKAWKRTHRTQHTATKVAVAGGNVIWQQLPDKLLSFCCWNVRHSTIFPDQTEHTRSHGSEMRVTTKIRQAQKENMLQRFQPFSHRRISRVMT